MCVFKELYPPKLRKNKTKNIKCSNVIYSYIFHQYSLELCKIVLFFHGKSESIGRTSNTLFPGAGGRLESKLQKLI